MPSGTGTESSRTSAVIASSGTSKPGRIPNRDAGANPMAGEYLGCPGTRTSDSPRSRAASSTARAPGARALMTGRGRHGRRRERRGLPDPAPRQQGVRRDGAARGLGHVRQTREPEARVGAQRVDRIGLVPGRERGPDDAAHRGDATETLAPGPRTVQWQSRASCSACPLGSSWKVQCSTSK